MQILCQDNIRQLETRYPELASDEEFAGKSCDEDSVALAVKICQSIEYLMQEEMRLFGPSSVILPLRVAYDTFRSGGSLTSEKLRWCQRIIARILGKGFQFITLFFEVFMDTL